MWRNVAFISEVKRINKTDMSMQSKICVITKPCKIWWMCLVSADGKYLMPWCLWWSLWADLSWFFVLTKSVTNLHVLFYLVNLNLCTNLKLVHLLSWAFKLLAEINHCILALTIQIILHVRTNFRLNKVYYNFKLCYFS